MAIVCHERPALVALSSDARLQAFLAEQPDWVGHGIYRCAAVAPGLPDAYVVMEMAASALALFEAQRGWLTPAHARAAVRRWRPQRSRS